MQKHRDDCSPKVFVMKTFKFLTVILLALFTITACQKDDVAVVDDPVALRTQDEPKMVPLKGHFSTTPDPAAPPVTCYFNDQPIVQSNGAYIYDANITHLGELDPEESMSNIISCVILDIQVPVVEFGQLVTWKNYEGDGLTFEGTSTLYGPAFGGEANWIVTGGFGKFENATGWVHATSEGQGYGATVDGMVTQPNH
jgi:hypothetical protein